VIYGRPLACRQRRPRRRRGPRVKPFTPELSGPSGRDPLLTVMPTGQLSMRGGAGQLGTRSGLDAGGAAPHNARLLLPDATTTTSTSGLPCRAPAARRARGAGGGSERWPDAAAARPGRVGPA
jgi:hypothetical protein